MGENYTIQSRLSLIYIVCRKQNLFTKILLQWTKLSRRPNQNAFRAVTYQCFYWYVQEKYTYEWFSFISFVTNKTNKDNNVAQNCQYAGLFEKTSLLVLKILSILLLIGAGNVHIWMNLDFNKYMSFVCLKQNIHF